jgi:CheY-like chemotaxis protein
MVVMTAKVSVACRSRKTARGLPEIVAPTSHDTLREMSPVLVVDDDADLCASIKAALEVEGYEVVTAANGREALNHLNRVDFPARGHRARPDDADDEWLAGADIIARGSRPQKIPIILTSAYFGDRFVGDPYTMLPKPFARTVAGARRPPLACERLETEGGSGDLTR